MLAAVAAAASSPNHPNTNTGQACLLIDHACVGSSHSAQCVSKRVTMLVQGSQHMVWGAGATACGMAACSRTDLVQSHALA